MSMRNKISHIFFVLIYCFQNIDGRIFEGSWWYLSYVEKSTFEASNLPVVKESTFSELVCNLEANSNETIEAYCLVDNQCYAGSSLNIKENHVTNGLSEPIVCRSI